MRTLSRLLIFSLLSVAALWQIFSVHLPPLGDLPNHLSRSYLIAFLGQHPELQQFYAIKFTAVPDLAMDVIVPPLAKLVGIFAAGKLFVALIILLTLTGVHVVHRALYGRFTIWPNVAFIFIYHWVMLFGFENYLFGIGAALWAFATWVFLREQRPLLRAAVSLLCATTLFFIHLYAFGLYGLAVLCFEATRAYAKRRVSMIDLIVFAAPFFVFFPLMAISPTAGDRGLLLWNFPYKFNGLYWIIKTFQPWLDIPVGFACLGSAIWAWRTGRLIAPPVALVYACAAAGVYAVMPSTLFGSGYSDVRFPIAAVFFMIPLLVWRPLNRQEDYGVIAFVAICAAIKFSIIGTTFDRLQPDVNEYEKAVSLMPVGSRVIVATYEQTRLPMPVQQAMQHMPSLCIIERSCFFSNTFAAPAKQPLEIKKPYRNWMPFDGKSLDLARLVADKPGHYYSNWHSHFDYLFVNFAETDDRIEVPGTEEVYRGRMFRLYRIQQ